MMMIFEDLDCWRKARTLVKGIYELTRQTDLSRDFGLVNQIHRAGVSIMSNTAEGFERNHVAEKLQFYNVARASNAEVRSLLYVIEDNFVTCKDEAIRLRSEAGEVGRLVTSLIQATERRKAPNILSKLIAALLPF